MDCMLIEELKRLKKSSQDAVDNDSSFSAFKQYMHIHRKVEDDLIEIIAQARKNSKKSLILVCGNVGDGKSHLISYLKHHKNGYLNGFVIHNDATESRSRNRNEKEELARVLEDFNDYNIDNVSETKVIVAINLGVLSNFIDSDEGAVFTRLAEYVNKNKILIDTDISTLNNESESVFYSVNFGDYHIYRLNNGIAESPYIHEFIDKIFCERQCNGFYTAYQRCLFCEMNDICPVKCNFEMMGNPTVRTGVTNIILEAVIKDKIILSTREMLDFFFDIIVHPDFEPSKYKRAYKKNKIKSFVEYSLPTILYSYDDSSLLLSHIKQYDYINVRSEKFDNVITKFNITDTPADVFSQYIEDTSCLRLVIANSSEVRKDEREELSLFLARMCKVMSKDSSIITINTEFAEFISYLYYASRKDITELKGLYRLVMKCVSLWNGSSEENLNLNTTHEDYVISTHLKFDVDISDYSKPYEETVFERFPININLTFVSQADNSKKENVSIDYDLYNMLKKVEKGYRPSAKDSNMFAGFVSFINKLSAFGNQDKEIIIRHFLSDSDKEYVLKKDLFGTYEFREVK